MTVPVVAAQYPAEMMKAESSYRLCTEELNSRLKMVSAMTHHAVAHHLPQRDYRRPSDGKQTYVDCEIQPGHANKWITINIFIRHSSQTKTQKHAASYICKPPPSYRTRWADNMIRTVSPRSFLTKKSLVYHQADGEEQIVRPTVCLSVCLSCLL